MIQTYPGLLFTMVGPAGAGKNTVMKRAIALLPELRQLPTATTRVMRSTEAEGREHFFMDVTDFERLREGGKLLEHQIVHGNWYGIARDPLDAALSAGEMMVADIDMYGAEAARAAYPRNTVLIFVAPPSIPILAARMRERGETQAEIARRMLRVQGEMAFAPECDYVLTNDSLEEAAQALLNIIAWERRQHDSRLKGASMATLQYQVRMLVMDGDTVVVSEAGRLPEQIFQAAQTPHTVALEMLPALGLLPPASALSTFRHDTTFIPPALVEMETIEGQDRCVYYYAVRLAERPPLAGGWRWQHVDNVSLPDELRARIAEPVVMT